MDVTLQYKQLCQPYIHISWDRRHKMSLVEMKWQLLCVFIWIFLLDNVYDLSYKVNMYGNWTGRLERPVRAANQSTAEAHKDSVVWCLHPDYKWLLKYRVMSREKRGNIWWWITACSEYWKSSPELCESTFKFRWNIYLYMNLDINILYFVP